MVTLFSSSGYCGFSNDASCILASEGKLRLIRLEHSLRPAQVSLATKAAAASALGGGYQVWGGAQQQQTQQPQQQQQQLQDAEKRDPKSQQPQAVHRPVNAVDHANMSPRQRLQVCYGVVSSA